MRYFLHLSYDGTNYCGWQVQANAPSVQETINKALHKLLRQPISSMGCGRTDTGVHAKDFYMHFNAENEIADPADFLFRLNCVLPDDITIKQVIPLPPEAHARFDATERVYEYFMHFDKSEFIKKYSFYQGFYEIDWEKVCRVSEFLTTVHDFTSLCLPSEDFKTNICRVNKAVWQVLPAHHLVLKPYNTTDEYPLLKGYGPIPKASGKALRFTIASNRFLRGMVRKTVGTMLMVGKGKIQPDEFMETVTAKKEFKVHYLAPANGLFLSKVVYPYLPETLPV